MIPSPFAKRCLLVSCGVIAACAVPSAVTPRPKLLYALPLRSALMVNAASGEEVMLEVSDGATVEDDWLSITIAADQDGFAFEISNPGNRSMRLHWDQASFVGSSGLAGKVVVGETRVMDIAREQRAQSVPGRSTAPAYGVPIRFGDPVVMVLFDRAASCEELLKQEFRLVLPIELGGETREYDLTFGPSWIDILAERPPPTEIPIGRPVKSRVLRPGETFSEPIGDPEPRKICGTPPPGR